MVSLVRVRKALIWGAVLVSLAVPVLAATSSARAATPMPAPTGILALVISVTDGVTMVKPGQEVTYSVGVRNGNPTQTVIADVQLTPPSGSTLGAVRNKGSKEKNLFKWRVTIEGGKSIQLTATATPGAATLKAKDIKGLAALACITQRGVPVICSSDVNQIPDRPSISATTGDASGSGGPASSSGVWWSLAGGAGLIIVAGATWGFFLRRRRSSRQEALGDSTEVHGRSSDAVPHSR
jgi:hypothetical protein